MNNKKLLDISLEIQKVLEKSEITSYEAVGVLAGLVASTLGAFKLAYDEDVRPEIFGFINNSYLRFIDLKEKEKND